MTTEHTESAHTNTEAAEVEESGNLLETEVEETVEETVESPDAPEATPFELPEEYRDNPRFADVDSEAALFKKIAESGAPESYDFEEGFDEQYAGLITEHAKKADMSQEQVQAMLDFSATIEQQTAELQAAEIKKGVQSLQQEWGSEFKENVEAANKAIRAFDTDGEIRKLMKANPMIANNPAVVKMFHLINSKIEVDRFLDSEGRMKTTPRDQHGQKIFTAYEKSMR